MDDESWYSVTPEEIAIYIAKNIPDNYSSTILDPFCGCGGNVIQFSKYFSKVFANDIINSKIELCKINSKVYECEDNIIYTCKDFLEFSDNFKCDYIFLSPPWGGSNYKDDNNFSLKNWIHPDIGLIINKALTISNNIIFYLPRNTDLKELCDILYDVHSYIDDDYYGTFFLDVKYLCSANKIKAILVLYGTNFSPVKIKEVKLFIKSKFIKSYVPYKDNFILISKLVNAARCLGINVFYKEAYVFLKKNNMIINHKKNFNTTKEIINNDQSNEENNDNIDNENVEEDINTDINENKYMEDNKVLKDNITEDHDNEKKNENTNNLFNPAQLFLDYLIDKIMTDEDKQSFELMNQKISLDKINELTNKKFQNKRFNKKEKKKKPYLKNNRNNNHNNINDDSNIETVELINLEELNSMFII